MIPIHTKAKIVAFKVLIYISLPHNILSATPVVKKLGAFVLDQMGAVIVLDQCYKAIQSHLKCFTSQSKNLYTIKAQQVGYLYAGVCRLSITDNPRFTKKMHNTATGEIRGKTNHKYCDEDSVTPINRNDNA